MSLRLLLIRHGPTAWNKEGRIQGHTDVDLSPEGCRALAGLRVPEPWAQGACFSSPLRRARHTARLLHPVAWETVPALTEMSWGEWEGATLEQLRRQYGAHMARNEARGLDFRPTGGESPRDVTVRLQHWLASLPPSGAACAVTHKGVIRAMLALATGWDMVEDFHAHLCWNMGQGFRVEDGQACIDQLNVPLRRVPD